MVFVIFCDECQEDEAHVYLCVKSSEGSCYPHIRAWQMLGADLLLCVLSKLIFYRVLLSHFKFWTIDFLRCIKQSREYIHKQKNSPEIYSFSAALGKMWKTVNRELDLEMENTSKYSLVIWPTKEVLYCIRIYPESSMEDTYGRLFLLSFRSDWKNDTEGAPTCTSVNSHMIMWWQSGHTY